MKTIIQVWNPRYSSFCMFDFLNELIDAGSSEYEPVFTFKNLPTQELSEGDLLYLYLKGISQEGIVAKGVVFKAGYPTKHTDEVRITPDVMIDPSVFSLLHLEGMNVTTDTIIVLTEHEAQDLSTKWEEYMSELQKEFEEYMHSNEFHGYDKLFINDQVRGYLYYDNEEDFAQIKMSRRCGLQIKYVAGSYRKIISSKGESWRKILARFSAKNNSDLVESLVKRFRNVKNIRPLVYYLEEQHLNFYIESNVLWDS